MKKESQRSAGAGGGAAEFTAFVNAEHGDG